MLNVSRLFLLLAVVMTLKSCKKEPLEIPFSANGLISNTTNQSPNSQSFQRILVGNNWFQLVSAAQSPSGGYILAGYNRNRIHELIEVVLIKTNANGETVWAKQFDNYYSNENISVDFNHGFGGYVLSMYGKPMDTNLIDKAGLTYKIGENAQLIWEKTFVQDGLYNFGRITRTASNNNFLAIGNMNLGNSSNAVLVNYNNSGSELWRKQQNGVYLSDIKRNNDFGYVISGYGLYGNSIASYVGNLDVDGNLLWSKFIPETGNSTSVSVEALMNGEIVIAGLYNNQPNRSYLMKLTNSGDLLWKKDLSVFSPSDEVKSVVQDVTGNIVVVGNTSAGAIQQGFVCKFTEDGDLVYSKTFRQGSKSAFNHVSATADNGLIISGYLEIGGVNQGYLVKLNSNGE